MKLPVYGLSFCILVAAATLATLGFLPDAFSSAVAQQEQDLATPIEPDSMAETPVYESAPAPPAIVLERNPFISDNGASSASDSGQAPSSPVNSMAFAPEGTLPALNAPLATPSVTEPAPSGLLGVVVGDRAFALVRDQGATRIVRAGDRFDGHTISRITTVGITFTDGSQAKMPLPE
jgi:hypothetical protein